MTDSIRAVAEAARAYTAASVHRTGLAQQLASAEERAQATRERLRELLPPALAACPDAAAWRALVRRIEALVEGEGLLADLPLPLPRNGEVPWPAQEAARG